MKETVKGYCKESKCEYDVYTKEKIDELLSTINTLITTLSSNSYTKQEIDTVVQTINNSMNNYQKKIPSGTELPTTGNEGDIFIKY